MSTKPTEKIQFEFNGCPVRSRNPKFDPYLFSKAELEGILDEVYDVDAQIFDLSNHEQFTKYRDLLALTGKGKVRIFSTDRHWIDQTQNWKVLVEYATIFYEPISR